MGGMDFADLLVLLVHVANHKSVTLATEQLGMARHEETSKDTTYCGAHAQVVERLL